MLALKQIEICFDLVAGKDIFGSPAPRLHPQCVFHCLSIGDVESVTCCVRPRNLKHLPDE